MSFLAAYIGMKMSLQTIRVNNSSKRYSPFKKNKFVVGLCVCVSVHECAMVSMCGGQRTTCWNLFSQSTMWVLWILHSLWDSVTSSLTH